MPFEGGEKSTAAAYTVSGHVVEQVVQDITQCILSRLFALFTLNIRRCYVHIVAAKTEFSRKFVCWFERTLGGYGVSKLLRSPICSRRTRNQGVEKPSGKAHQELEWTCAC